MITEQDLAVLGLSRNLTLLYLAILRSGGQGAAQLAAATGLKRSHVYALADQLVAENLVSVDFVGAKRRYTARDPEILRAQAQDRLAAVSRLMPELRALRGAGAVKPALRYYEGRAGARVVFDELSAVKGGAYRYFGSLAAQMAVEGLDNAKKSVRRRLERGIRSRSIRTREADLDEPVFMAGEEYLREVRYFPRLMPPDCPDLYIYDHTLAILAAGREHYALIIESPELAGLLGAVWDMVWDISLTLEQVRALTAGRSPKAGPG